MTLRSLKLRRWVYAAAFFSISILGHAQGRAFQYDQANMSREINKAIADASSYYHLDPRLVSSVIKTESNYYPFAVSPRGALGLMQLMPRTAWNLGVRNPFSPRENVFAGCLYLSQLMARYQNANLALAAYNAGSGAVDSHRGIPPYRETVGYINQIAYLYRTQHFMQLQKTAEAVAASTLGEHRPTF